MFLQPSKDVNNKEANDDNEEEFLSPESESDHDNEDKLTNDNELLHSKNEENTKEETQSDLEHTLSKDDNKETELKKDEEDKQIHTVGEKDNDQTETVLDQEQSTESKVEEDEATFSTELDKGNETALELQVNNLYSHKTDENTSPNSIENAETDTNVIEETFKTSEESTEKYNEPVEKLDEPSQGVENQSDEEVSDTIEEPVMVVTGEGNGAECESSYIIGEEIIEDVMYFFGEGCGYDNDTGNPETIENESAPEPSDEDNLSEDRLNGEHPVQLNTSKKVKGIKLKSHSSVTKRSLKKQSNDTTEVVNIDSKKHCVRHVEKSESSNSNGKNIENDIKLNHDKSDSENVRNTLKKSRGKVKKKSSIRNIKFRSSKDIINSVTEADSGQDNKANIIEKRKSSVSSEQDKDSENDKEDSPDKDLKAEEPLPPKKLRLEPTPDRDITHSKDNAEDSIDNANESILDLPISKRKKIKANKAKLKMKGIINDDVVNKEKDKKVRNDRKENKSLKRSLLDTTVSNKNKTESQSEADEEEPMTSRKRLKIKPKKVMMATRYIFILDHIF